MTNSFRDLITSRSDIRNLRQWYLDVKDNSDTITSVKDLIPLTPGNDLGYIRPSDLDRAEWFAEIWRNEGRPEIHPRGMHYRILGKGYDRPRDAGPYVNDTKSWSDMADGAFYAQVLGLVDPDMIRDEKNPDPTVTVEVGDERKWEDVQREGVKHVPSTRYSSPTIPTDWGLSKPSLEYDEASEWIEKQASVISYRLRSELEYKALTHQGRYVEIWAEKSGVIPTDVAREYGAVIRPAGGGEMSYNMVRDAVKRAKRRGQDLAIVLITDFDPKGRDMPKSVARKIEVEAALEGIHAEVHHGAVTMEQVQHHGLPGDPAKTPDGDSTGAKAYETHKQLFLDYAGQHPVEIQAYSGRHEAEFAAEIERFLEPYHDPSVQRKLRNALSGFRDDLRESIEEYLYRFEDDIQAYLDATEDSIDEYNDLVGEQFDEVEEAVQELQESHEEAMDETGLDDVIGEFEEWLENVDLDSAVEDLEFDPPYGDIDWDDLPTPLLDTTRPLDEQIHAYKDFDIRSA